MGDVHTKLALNKLLSKPTLVSTFNSFVHLSLHFFTVNPASIDSLHLPPTHWKKLMAQLKMKTVKRAAKTALVTSTHMAKEVLRAPFESSRQSSTDWWPGGSGSFHRTAGKGLVFWVLVLKVHSADRHWVPLSSQHQTTSVKTPLPDTPTHTFFFPQVSTTFFLLQGNVERSLDLNVLENQKKIVVAIV